MNSKYSKCVEDSEKVAWKISEVFPDDFQFNFDKNFLPKSLTLEDKIMFLTREEKRDLNHIRSASYINLFAYVEEYITALMIRIASDSTFEENDRLRALLRFTEEEVKHQTLFLKFVKKFNNSFKIKCEFLTGADDVANIILSNSEISVIILTYHLELITQQHYLDAIMKDEEVDEKFSFILKKHWMEESQHAKLDLYELQRLVQNCTEDEKARAFHEYMAILENITTLLKKQSIMDFESLSRCSKKQWSDEEKNKLLSIQNYSHINNFVMYGLKNKTFRNEMAKIFPNSLEIIDAKIESIDNEFGEWINAA